MKMKKTTAKTTTPTNQLRDRCHSHFLTLRIPVEPAALDELLARAEKESLTHLRFLDLLLGTQADARRERAVARRIRDAHFAENKTLEGFSWEFNPKAFDRVQIEELATGDFIRRHTNLILVGWSGVGKSHIIQALGQKACVHGYRVLYRTSAQLLTDLTASLADKSLPAKLRRYASPDLLIIVSVRESPSGDNNPDRPVDCWDQACVTFQLCGSSSARRVMGWAAIRERTSLNQA
jgi:DNA replication protein DnaC